MDRGNATQALHCLRLQQLCAELKKSKAVFTPHLPGACGRLDWFIGHGVVGGGGDEGRVWRPLEVTDLRIRSTRTNPYHHIHTSHFIFNQATASSRAPSAAWCRCCAPTWTGTWRAGSAVGSFLVVVIAWVGGGRVFFLFKLDACDDHHGPLCPNP